jgi:hypothetical protein
MIAVDQEEKPEEPDLFEKIQEALQVTRSLSSLLLKSQRKVDGNIAISQKYLLEISSFIINL